MFAAISSNNLSLCGQNFDLVSDCMNGTSYNDGPVIREVRAHCRRRNIAVFDNYCPIHCSRAVIRYNSTD